MKRKTIDTSREMRLWLGQIFIPAATLVVTALSIPGVRQKAVSGFDRLKSKFNKEKNVLVLLFLFAKNTMCIMRERLKNIIIKLFV